MSIARLSRSPVYLTVMKGIADQWGVFSEGLGHNDAYRGLSSHDIQVGTCQTEKGHPSNRVSIHIMKHTFFSLLVVLAFSTPFAAAEILDDFSAEGWQQSSSTPGKLSVQQGELHLEDGAGEPDWMTASKTFRVDFDKTPFFVVKVTDVSDSGTVKLIRKKPYDKRETLKIDRPGLYAVNMRDAYGWKGVGDVETCLYTLGSEEEATYEFVKYCEELLPEEVELIKKTAISGNTRLQFETFEVVPSFNSCSFYLPAAKPCPLVVSYREQGGDWLHALPPPYMAEDAMYRGSVVGLKENTIYEIKITADSGEILGQQEFTTWRSDVPIANTIVLDEATFPGHLVIRDNGKPDGWIRYTAREGFTLENDRTGPLLELYKAKYVILEGLKLRGGLKEVIRIEKCDHVRVVNCDISGWGRIGTQRFDLDGKYYTENGKAINWDSAILIKRSTGTVVERCYIHDPVNTANPWYYSHPAGPQAVGIDKPTSTVIRYNDFIGSDLHRWNDAVEGAGNFHVDGGFNCDADIYGNLMCFANDDAIEIDGGQTNVRVFLNKFEGCLCGVSIQGCMSSPSYVWRNLLVNMGDENGVGGQTIKTSSFANGKNAVSFIFNNTCYGSSSDLSLRHNLRIVTRNNIFAGQSAISGRQGSAQSDCDYNLLSTGETGDEEHGILGEPEFVNAKAGLFDLTEESPAVGRGMPIPDFAPAEQGRVDMGAIPFDSDLILPVRPIPVSLDRYQLEFSPAKWSTASAQPVTASVGGIDFSSGYRIAQNAAFDWFRVSPHSGTLESGQKTIFTVTLIPEKMQSRRIFRGAFLVRLADGYSRPVMIYAETDVVPEARPTREGVFVEYIEAEMHLASQDRARVQDPHASGGACFLLSRDTSKRPVEYRFSVPKSRKYFLLMRIRSDAPVSAHDTVRFALDDGSPEEACLLSGSSWCWSLMAHNRKQRLTRLQAFELDAGEHVLKITPQESLYADLIGITDNPAMFD